MTKVGIEPALITKVEPGSPAAVAGIKAGDRLATLNGRALKDVIDYQLAREADELDFHLVREGRSLDIHLTPDGRPLGLALEKSIFDRQKLCRNQCAFCFIDQLPPGTRSTLHIKDDDFRLSFLYGNFITLTNLSRTDLARIVRERLSPLYASVHAIDPDVRRRLIGPPKSDRALENLKTILDGNIEVHIQVVACPGVNDGAVLSRTLESLYHDFPTLGSVGIVPVGLTGWRRELPELEPFDKPGAIGLIEQVREVQDRATRERQYRWVYAADEFYLLAGMALPPALEYDDFPQVENGIGIARLFMDEVADWISSNGGQTGSGADYSILTGPLASDILGPLLPGIERATGSRLDLIVADNKWLGGSVTVTGLLAGADLIEAINEASPDSKVLVPAICLNSDGLFIDDLTVDDIRAAIGADLVVVPSTGWDFMEALVGG